MPAVTTDIIVNNQQIVAKLLKGLSPTFYGEMLLQFVNGRIQFAKTTKSEKFAYPDEKTPEINRANCR